MPYVQRDCRPKQKPARRNQEGPSGSWHSRCPGGGGHGVPAERDPKLIETDLRDGLVSRAFAEDNYDVLVDDNGSVTRPIAAD